MRHSDPLPREIRVKSRHTSPDLLRTTHIASSSTAHSSPTFSLMMFISSESMSSSVEASAEASPSDVPRISSRTSSTGLSSYSYSAPAEEASEEAKGASDACRVLQRVQS